MPLIGVSKSASDGLFEATISAVSTVCENDISFDLTAVDNGGTNVAEVQPAGWGRSETNAKGQGSNPKGLKGTGIGWSGGRLGHRPARAGSGG